MANMTEKMTVEGKVIPKLTKEQFDMLTEIRRYGDAGVLQAAGRIEAEATFEWLKENELIAYYDHWWSTYDGDQAMFEYLLEENERLRHEAEAAKNAIPKILPDIVTIIRRRALDYITGEREMELTMEEFKALVAVIPQPAIPGSYLFGARWRIKDKFSRIVENGL